MTYKDILKKEADDFNADVAGGVINLINAEMLQAARRGEYYINYPLTYVAEEEEILKYYTDRNFTVDTIITDDYGLTLHIDWS